MKVLLIEHHHLLARPLKQGLEEEGYLVVLAPDGTAAEREVRTRMFEVIILDPELPAEDGLCLLQRWRSNGLPTPVLVLTARSGVAEKVRALNLGADDFLGMPFDLDDLLGRLRVLGKLPQGRLPKDLRKEQLPCGKSRTIC